MFLCPPKHHAVKEYWASEVQFQTFLTSALDVSEWSPLYLGRCPLDRRLCRLQKRSGHGSEEKNSRFTIYSESNLFKSRPLYRLSEEHFGFSQSPQANFGIISWNRPRHHHHHLTSSNEEKARLVPRSTNAYCAS